MILIRKNEQFQIIKENKNHAKGDMNYP